jgi:NADH-quinone oxidoreductase subunit H
MRYDQFMKFGWKVLIPVSLLWIMVVSTLRVMSAQHTSKAIIIAFSVGVVLVVFAAGQLYESTKTRHAKEDELGEVESPNFPVPQIKKAGE